MILETTQYYDASFITWEFKWLWLVFVAKWNVDCDDFMMTSW